MPVTSAVFNAPCNTNRKLGIILGWSLRFSVPAWIVATSRMITDPASPTNVDRVPSSLLQMTMGAPSTVMR